MLNMLHARLRKWSCQWQAAPAQHKQSRMSYLLRLGDVDHFGARFGVCLQVELELGT